MTKQLMFLVTTSDGHDTQTVTDMYWFEENGIHEVIDGVGKGHFEEEWLIEPVEVTLA